VRSCLTGVGNHGKNEEKSRQEIYYSTTGFIKWVKYFNSSSEPQKKKENRFHFKMNKDIIKKKATKF
jgi:hypothetical protein